MTAKTINVLIHRKTHARLIKLREQMLRDYAEGRIDIPDAQVDNRILKLGEAKHGKGGGGVRTGISFDYVINELIRRLREHRRRARLSRRRRGSGGEAMAS